MIAMDELKRVQLQAPYKAFYNCPAEIKLIPWVIIMCLPWVRP